MASFTWSLTSVPSSPQPTHPWLSTPATPKVATEKELVSWQSVKNLAYQRYQDTQARKRQLLVMDRQLYVKGHRYHRKRFNGLPAVIQNEVVGYLTLFDYHCFVRINHYWYQLLTSRSLPRLPPKPKYTSWFSSKSNTEPVGDMKSLMSPAIYSFDTVNMVQWIERISHHHPYGLILKREPDPKRGRIGYWRYQSILKSITSTLIDKDHQLAPSWARILPSLRSLDLQVPVPLQRFDAMKHTLESLSLTGNWRHPIDYYKLVTPISSLLSLTQLTVNLEGMQHNVMTNLVGVLPVSLRSFTSSFIFDTALLTLLHTRLPSLTYLDVRVIDCMKAYQPATARDLTKIIVSWPSLVTVKRALPYPSSIMAMSSFNLHSQNDQKGSDDRYYNALPNLRSFTFPHDSDAYGIAAKDSLEALALVAPSLTEIHNITVDSSWFLHLSPATQTRPPGVEPLLLSTATATTAAPLNDGTNNNGGGAGIGNGNGNGDDATTTTNGVDVAAAAAAQADHDALVTTTMNQFVSILSSFTNLSRITFWRFYHTSSVKRLVTTVQPLSRWLTDLHLHVDEAFTRADPSEGITWKHLTPFTRLQSLTISLAHRSSVQNDTMIAASHGAVKWFDDKLSDTIPALRCITFPNGYATDLEVFLRSLPSGVTSSSRIEIAGGVSSIKEWLKVFPHELSWSSFTVNTPQSLAYAKTELVYLADMGCTIHDDTRSANGIAFVMATSIAAAAALARSRDNDDDEKNDDDDDADGDGAKVIAYRPPAPDLTFMPGPVAPHVLTRSSSLLSSSLSRLPSSFLQ